MLLTPISPASQLIAVAALGWTVAFGPPRISVREVTDRAAAPAGAVLLVDGRHHADGDPLTITGRAEGTRDGRRVTVPLTLVNAGAGRYGVTRQWTVGVPWVLVLAAGEGNNGAHGVAEALVRINAAGAIVGIDYPAAGWIGKTNSPKRTTEREIEAALSSLAVARASVRPSR
jgi:hypothetical protein